MLGAFKTASINWRALGFELLIVFVGLLAALQVEGWRERRSWDEAETRLLQRLRSDLADSLDELTTWLPKLEHNRDSVEHVATSLRTGRVLDDDVATFEWGLIHVNVLPSASINRAAYDEMVATGMFTRLRSAELQGKVSRLYSMHDRQERNFEWWRGPALRLADTLYDHLELYNEGEQRRDDPVMLREPTRRARFDFGSLARDPQVVNGFYWAADIHSDWHGWFERLADAVRGAKVLVDEELAERTLP
jgi:hypothetical protein